MREKNEKIKFYVAMDGRWAQLSRSDREICDLLKKVTVSKTVAVQDMIQIIHIN